jgi:UDP-2,3-diacylglucosamine pyrophosphatase LpxH
MFDQVTLDVRWLSMLGDQAYEVLLGLNTAVNWCRRRLGLKYKSYSQYMKQNVKRAMNYVHRFEEIISLHTRKYCCDGVVCGHVHTPVIKSLGDLTYYNCGDWIESCTALLEHDDGQIELVVYSESPLGVLDETLVEAAA